MVPSSPNQTSAYPLHKTALFFVRTKISPIQLPYLAVVKHNIRESRSEKKKKYRT